VHVVRKIAGHGTLAMTQRYLHPGEWSITAAGAALAAYLRVRRSPWSPNCGWSGRDLTNAMAYANAARNLLSSPAEQALFHAARNRREGTPSTRAGADDGRYGW
jgi:hypothetical protein